ncbi:MAG: gluconokinase [Nocardioides sp.]|uniref:gluconokinase n=1 Tax=Nocardioides sp. TaxID=35761 RepID=UPI0039E4F61A
MTRGIALEDAVPPLVLALDVGSTACRGALYDAAGRPVDKRVKMPHTFTSAPDGTSVIDPDQVASEIIGLLDQLAARVEPGTVGGIAFDTFASSLVAVDDDGRALTPCFTYADGRCAAEVDGLREEVDELELQQRTGTRIHSSYWPARLRWLTRTEPGLRARQYLSLGDYVYRRVLGETFTGTSTAAWTGLIDRRSCDWSPEMVRLSGIEVDQLPPIRHLDEPFEPTGESARRVAQRWPALAGAQWFAPVADGLSANVGLGASDATMIGASGATSGALRVLVDRLPADLPTGLWCYAVSRDRWLLGGALNDVGRATDWLDANLDPARLADERVSAALLADPVPGTPLVLPFLTGERSTGWASDARGILIGVTAATGAIELYRGMAEGIALSFARVAAELRAASPRAEGVAAGGRVAVARPELFQIVSDVIGVPIKIVDAKRSTLLGTAHLALDTLAPGRERYQFPPGHTCEPVAGREQYYAERLANFERVYDALIRR